MIDKPGEKLYPHSSTLLCVQALLKFNQEIKLIDSVSKLGKLFKVSMPPPLPLSLSKLLELNI